MKHFRHVGSLQEDFAALGLVNKKPSAPGFPRETPDQLSESQLDEDGFEDLDLDAIVEEEDSELDALIEDNSESLTEDELNEDELNEDEIDEVRLVRQRLKRGKPGDRAKARQDYRKNRTQILRDRKRRAKKAGVKIKRAKFQKLKGGRSAGTRKRFALAASSEKLANLMESITDVDLELTGNVHEELERGFANVDAVASMLCRKFAIIEEMEHGLPVEHPESEYGEEGDENMKDGGKTGDATDSASDAPKGNITHGDDHPDHKTPKGNVKFEGEEYDDDEDDDDDDDSDSDEMEESKFSSVDMAQLRAEASDSMDKLKTHVISPAEAGVILKDMVTYLGGAMKSYMDLAKSVAKNAYPGEDMPMDVGHNVKDNVDQAGHEYIGKDQPEDADGNPKVLDRGRMGESEQLEEMKTGDIKAADKMFKDMMKYAKSWKKELHGKGAAGGDAGVFAAELADCYKAFKALRKSLGEGVE